MPTPADAPAVCDDCETPLTLAAVRVGSFRYCPDCADDAADDFDDEER